MDIPLLGCDDENADFLAIDDLLDFSNEEIGGPIDSSCLTVTTSQSCSPSNDISKLSPHAPPPKDKNSPLLPAGAFDSDGLCMPCDDLAQLEWLSNFVEASFSSNDHAAASFCVSSACGGSDGKSATDQESIRGTSKDSFQSTSPVSVLERVVHSRDKATSFTSGSDMLIPARARTKRGRTAVCFWNTRILSVEASESILESSSTASTITSDSDMINTFYDHDDDDYDENEDDDDGDDDLNDDNDDIDDNNDHYHHHQPKRLPSYMSMKVKKINKVMASLANNKAKKSRVQQEGGQQQQVVRKCLHCATQKTPQWRAGPMGPKTLCNACGVRYKSGRLCAEYRPAASPTFMENLHSNSHRKVLEMRRQRGEVSLNPSAFHGKVQCGLHRGV